MRKTIFLIALVAAFSCTETKKNERPAHWAGEWQATWKTDPASFEGIEGITDYTMPGKFIFTGDSLNIKAFGFEGCVFSKDTLDHVLVWKVSGDSLILINDQDTPGMVYSIRESGEKKIGLQLMDDIFLTLEK
ncbi:MAG: hypothetical protein ABJ004_05015 [Cyclobacteriaceae bacterium]